jgi:DNA-binding transcriptional ArsR family regulator
MAIHSSDLAPVFAALSDPTRMAVVERLCRGPASVSDLAAPHAMAGPSFLKHLKVLEGAGLVISTKSGRVRTVALVPQRFDEIEGWIRRHRAMWDDRLDRLGSFLERDTQ